MRRIRWGILSTGGIAATFTEDLLTLADAEVAAVGSRAGVTAAAFADRYGIPRAHGSWRALAEDPDVDVVYVATPHTAHHAAARACLDAGKAVLLEKPFTVNVREAEDLTALAAERGAFLMEGMWTRFLPAVRRIVGLVGSGTIGPVRAVSADFGLTGDFAPDHRLRSPALGGGALLDLGVYPVSLAHLFLGAPSTVLATGSRTAEGVDDTTAVALGYDSGAVATIACSLTADLPCTASITGTEGRVEIDRSFFTPSGFTLYRGAEAEEFLDPPTGTGYVHQAAEVMRCLREGLTESPLMPHADTLAVMRTLDAVRTQLGVAYEADTPPA